MDNIPTEDQLIESILEDLPNDFSAVIEEQYRIVSNDPTLDAPHIDELPFEEALSQMRASGLIPDEIERLTTTLQIWKNDMFVSPLRLGLIPTAKEMVIFTDTLNNIQNCIDDPAGFSKEDHVFWMNAIVGQVMGWVETMGKNRVCGAMIGVTSVTEHLNTMRAQFGNGPDTSNSLPSLFVTKVEAILAQRINELADEFAVFDDETLEYPEEAVRMTMEASFMDVDSKVDYTR